MTARMTVGILNSARNACLGALALFAAGTLWSAESGRPPATPSPAAPTPEPPSLANFVPAADLEKRLSVDWDQLPIAEVERILRETFKGVNFLVSPRIRDQSVGILKLRNATLMDILTAIRYSTDHRVTWSGEGENLIILQPAEAPPHRSRTMVEVLNLPMILDTTDRELLAQTIQQVTQTTKETAAEIYATEGAEEMMPHFKYHPGTGLLVVSGRPEGVQLAVRIVQNLRGSLLFPARKTAGPPPGSLTPPVGVVPATPGVPTGNPAARP